MNQDVFYLMKTTENTFAKQFTQYKSEERLGYNFFQLY